MGKGNPNPVGNPKGRPKGSPNKATARAREGFALFVDETFDKFKQWILDIADDDKRAAADLYLRAAEFYLPKLARQELTGTDGEKLSVSISINGIRRERDSQDLGAAPDAGEVPRI